jgi:DNA polymerase-2
MFEGWLFDIDDLGPEVALWIYDEAGRLVRLTDQFCQSVYVQGQQTLLADLAGEMERRAFVTQSGWTDRIEVWSGDTIRVLELRIGDSSLMPQLRRLAAARDRDLVFYNCDIPAAQHYLYVKRLFPLCKLACEADPEGRVLELSALESPWNISLAMPKLNVMRMTGARMRPVSHASRIIFEQTGDELVLRLTEGAGAVESLNKFIDRHNPDVILSDGGDTLLMPVLLNLARQHRVPLLLDRDRIITNRKIQTEGRTYFSYGRIVYKGPSYPLFGRWHIDSNNSFIHREAEMEGLIELARLAKIPVQRMARTTPGSAMSSMEMDRAIADGILIPWHKSEPEQYKTALELLTVDKGGLVYQPPVGALERVAEIDFASMYPSIMVRHNVSPETVLCRCCSNSAVPEAGYTICEKREGLIPRTLAPLLERRKEYKRLIKESTGLERFRYDSRQSAIKWMLVSCFGYLGYKNARFGRIEAHEAVTAFGREKLLQAKEIAEAAGFRVLHALTDSLWIKLATQSERDILKLCERITRATQIEMSLEGLYRWLVFLPSKVNQQRPVATRYYGVFVDGATKIRGLACRRSDTPEFIKQVQLEMLAFVAAARNLQERTLLIERANVLLAERIAALEQGCVDPRRLVIKRTLTKQIQDYLVDTRTAVTARQLRDAGIRLHPGQGVRYVITDARSKEPSGRVVAGELIEGAQYDAREYVRLLKAAGAEVFAV